MGKYNQTDDDAIFIVGNGSSDPVGETKNLLNSNRKSSKCITWDLNTGLIQDSVFISQTKVNALTDQNTSVHNDIASGDRIKVGFLFEIDTVSHIEYLRIYGGIKGYTGFADTYSAYGFEQPPTKAPFDEKSLITSGVICNGEADGIPVSVDKNFRYIALFVEGWQNSNARIREIEAYGTVLNTSNAFTVNKDGTASVQSEPNREQDVVNKAYLDRVVGEIDTVLASIVSGGES